jgi:threonine synthase
MKYHSLNDPHCVREWPEAVWEGLAPDKGLYFPAELPAVPAAQLLDAGLRHPAEVGARLLAPLFAPQLSAPALEALLRDALDFPLPLVELEPGLWVLELFHGPTAAFKDVGARVMARLLAAQMPPQDAPLTVLVATSGDTGSAVAQGFLGMPGVRVVILFPRGRISHLQEMQLTTAGENVHAFEVDGSFDACQTLVKQAFLDASLRPRLPLTSANSINLARWMPQAVYYAWATQQLGQAVHFVVPSGNLGNLAAGVLAHRMGMPAAGFTAATNANDGYPQFLAGAPFEARPSVATLSNAMDVGDPSNRPRLDALFGDDVAALRRGVQGFVLDDAGTSREMAAALRDWGYLACPHTAVGLAAARALRHPASPTSPTTPIVALATAHPAKFAQTVTAATAAIPPLPPTLAACLERTPVKSSLPADYAALRAALLALPS